MADPLDLATAKRLNQAQDGVTIGELAPRRLKYVQSPDAYLGRANTTIVPPVFTPTYCFPLLPR